MRSLEKTFEYGNTVTLKCKFYDEFDVPTDPALLKIIFYDYKFKVIQEVSLDANSSVAIGEYTYSFVTEPKSQHINYEWYGEIGGLPSIKRGRFKTVFKN